MLEVEAGSAPLSNILNTLYWNVFWENFDYLVSRWVQQQDTSNQTDFSYLSVGACMQGLQIAKSQRLLGATWIPKEYLFYTLNIT